MRVKLAIVACLGTPVWAQSPLSLREAVYLALEQNRSIRAAAAGLNTAEARVAQARSDFLPKLNYAESFVRSDNPIFVFGSLLTQHRFTGQNFRLEPLNRPDALDNFQSQLTVDQILYDAGQTRNALRSAELMRNMSGEEGRRARMDVIAGVVRAYYGEVLSAENLKAAQEALRSAEADRSRAEAVRAAGMSTDVDVLSIRVHLAAVKEQQVRRAADLDVARAALNDVLGTPLDRQYTLTVALTPAGRPELAVEEYERQAVENRPEARQVKFATSLAETQARSARASLFPQVSVRAALEADRQRFLTRGGANWLTAVSLKWNLFNGFGDKARIREAGQGLRRAQAEEERAGSAIRLQVRRAYADWRAAQQRIEVAQAALAEAAESLRITQNRYTAGLSNVTDLLRNETALFETRTRYLAAVHDQRIAATMLELAAGTLTPESEALN